MPKRAVDVYWHKHRVGSIDFPVERAVLQISHLHAFVSKIRIQEESSIVEIAALPIAFDRDFAELRGITGVELE